MRPLTKGEKPMKKTKGQTVDFLYVNKNETKKKTKKVGTTSSRPQKNKKKKTKTRKTQNNSDTKINLDNEIIIGLTPKITENKTPKNNKKRRTSKKSNNKKTNNRPNQKQKNKTIKKQKPKSKYKNKIIKWIIILLLALAAVALFMLSSIFNIKQIIVLNNSKISSQEIINLSTLQVGINMFKTTNSTIKNGIKSNAYIEDVNIKRNLNGTVTLEIEEKVPTYMLKLENTYAYINNQGYILEISETALELPLITGFKTPNEQINAGSRLVEEDLIKLGDVIKIMETAKNLSLESLITQIDISNSNDYTLTLESESKTIKFGDISNADVKLRAIKVVLEAEKGKAGEIYFQDTNKTIFREEVAR